MAIRSLQASGFVGHRQRDLDGRTRAAALGRWQARGRGQHGGAGQIRQLGAQHGLGRRPRGQPGPEQAHALDEHAQTGHDTAPNTRLAFEPPKPNEFDSTARSGACRLLRR